MWFSALSVPAEIKCDHSMLFREFFKNSGFYPLTLNIARVAMEQYNGLTGALLDISNLHPSRIEELVLGLGVSNHPMF